MHTDPDVLTLLAVGDRTAASPDDLEHIAECPECSQELERFREVADVTRAVAGDFTLELPRPEVWESIRTELGMDTAGTSDPGPATEVSPMNHVPRSSAGVSPVSPSAAGGSSAATEGQTGRPPTVLRPRRTASSRALALAVAAALALVVGVVGTLVVQRVLGPKDTVVATTTLTALPKWTGSTGQAELEQDDNGNRWLVVTVSPSRSVDGFQQVWLMNPEITAMLPVGLLSEPQQRFLLPPDIDVNRYPVIDVSDQPATDNGAHSGNSIVRGTLPT